MPLSPHNPFSHIIRGVEADVLLALCQNPLYESVTTIARSSGRSRSEVRVVINYLMASGIVEAIADGGRRWYHLNRQHALYSQVLAIANTRTGDPATTRNACA